MMSLDECGAVSYVDRRMNAQRLNTSIRLDAEILDRLDRIAEAMTARAAGAPVNRSTAARVALERGLDALEAELKIPKTKAKK